MKWLGEMDWVNVDRDSELVEEGFDELRARKEGLDEFRA